MSSFSLFFTFYFLSFSLSPSSSHSRSTLTLSLMHAGGSRRGHQRRRSCRVARGNPSRTVHLSHLYFSSLLPLSSLTLPFYLQRVPFPPLSSGLPPLSNALNAHSPFLGLSHSPTLLAFPSSCPCPSHSPLLLAFGPEAFFLCPPAPSSHPAASLWPPPSLTSALTSPPSPTSVELGFRQLLLQTAATGAEDAAVSKLLTTALHATHKGTHTAVHQSPDPVTASALSPC